jgi:hypothetical protein
MYVLWNRCPIFSLLTPCPSPLSGRHRLVADSSSWIYPCTQNRTYTKYSSIEKFVKLPFQRVLIRLNRSLNEGDMAVSLQHCLLSGISARATIGDSAISACRNLRLPFRLIRWNVDYMELLKVQIYPIVFCWGCARHLDDTIILFVHRSGDVRVVFVLKSFKAPCHASLGFKSH